MYAEVVDGINLIWDNKFEEAEKIFGAKSATHPRHALHNAEVAFLRSFITADSSDSETAVSRLKHAKKLAEQHLKSYEKGTVPEGHPAPADKAALGNMHLDTRVVMGDVLYMLAVLQLTRDSKLKGALNMRKSWKVFEQSLKMVSNDKTGTYSEELVRCLNFGAGFFFFAMSIIPQKFLKLVELVGFKADRELGLKYIRDCYDAGGVRSPFASIVLLFNNLLLPRGLQNPAKYLKEADVLVQQSLAKYPNGSLFQVMGSHCARKQCNVDGGIKYMLDAIENCKTLGVAPLIYKFELASCYCMKLKWDVAAAQFEPLVESEKFQVRALCALLQAGCYIMMGQKDKAATLFQRVPTIIKKNSSVDPIVAAQAQRYLACGGHFSAFEILYIRRDLAKMENEIPQLMPMLEKIAAEVGANKPYAMDTNKGSGGLAGKLRGLSFGRGSGASSEPVDYSADNRASYMMLKGAMLRATNDINGAITCFKEVISLDSALKEKFFVPYSYYELAEALYHNNQLKEAQEAIKKCNNISGYAWEDPLKVRLRVTMDQLKKGGVLDDDESDPPSLVATNGAEPPVPISKDKDEIIVTPNQGLVIETSS